ncbi:MAG: hypothetical protein JSV80_00095 [Acidobacteriota bacterium]|nr:MAG: hypothetical protein JSV80_00095 [Acidobacteriota bacterium]
MFARSILALTILVLMALLIPCGIAFAQEDIQDDPQDPAEDQAPTRG